MSRRPDWDAVVIGGGFFGCCLALFLKSTCDRVLILEREDDLLQRASRVNQARIHTGFHYPRSMVTARRSRLLQARFAQAFPEAVVDDFQMLYAVARRRSKVSPSRFSTMFQALDAPFVPAPRALAALFDHQAIEAAYLCQEFAFDWRRLRDILHARLDAEGITLLRGVDALRVRDEGDRATVETSGTSVTTEAVFNVTYAGLNTVALASGLKPLTVKHELAEIALVRPPAELAGLAVTVMDGPFFSTMPYPAEGLHSLTHVRYTPHYSWVDAPGGRSAYAVAEALPREARARQMIADAARYLPCMAEAKHERSLWEVKTVRTMNEIDDGRPILLHRHDDCPRLISVLGAKLDNVFDLLDALPELNPRWRGARAEAVLA